MSNKKEDRSPEHQAELNMFNDSAWKQEVFAEIIEKDRADDPYKYRSANTVEKFDSITGESLRYDPYTGLPNKKGEIPPPFQKNIKKRVAKNLPNGEKLVKISQSVKNGGEGNHPLLTKRAGELVRKELKKPECERCITVEWRGEDENRLLYMVEGLAEPPAAEPAPTVETAPVEAEHPTAKSNGQSDERVLLELEVMRLEAVRRSLQDEIRVRQEKLRDADNKLAYLNELFA